MGNKQVVDVYIKIINIWVFAVLLILNLCSIIASGKFDLGFNQTAFHMPTVQFKLIEICLVSILLIVNIITIVKDSSIIKKIMALERIKMNKYQKEIDLQYKVLEKIASLYDSTVKCTNEKSEFFYNMSHELKTPITVILGAIQLIEQNKVPLQYDRRKSSKHITTIKQNCYRLLRLINNMLDMSRIESGYIKSNLVNCNIVNLIRNLSVGNTLCGSKIHNP